MLLYRFIYLHNINVCIRIKIYYTIIKGVIVLLAVNTHHHFVKFNSMFFKKKKNSTYVILIGYKTYAFGEKKSYNILFTIFYRCRCKSVFTFFNDDTHLQFHINSNQNILLRILIHVIGVRTRKIFFFGI